MFTSIKTSRANKDIVTDLSRKFNLGAENIIARIALTYSLSKAFYSTRVQSLRFSG